MSILNALNCRGKSLANVYNQVLSRMLPKVVIRSTRKRGLLLNRPVFTISFDCETEFDSMVVEEVHEKLKNIGINPMYAVPGEVLLRDLNIYRNIKNTGAVFINHGFAQHSQYNISDEKYDSQFFYDNLARDEISQDILKGHDTLSSVLGVQPRIFRTPHFATFQKPHQLRWLWKQLRELDYLVSSSTGPFFAYKNGMISHQGGLYEVSVSSHFSKPWRILDSWSHFVGNEIGYPRSEFIDALDGYLSAMNNGENILVNIYADPLHVSNWPEFFVILSRFAKFQMKDFLEVISTVDS